MIGAGGRGHDSLSQSRLQTRGRRREHRRGSGPRGALTCPFSVAGPRYFGARSPRRRDRSDGAGDFGVGPTNAGSPCHLQFARASLEMPQVTRARWSQELGWSISRQDTQCRWREAGTPRCGISASRLKAAGMLQSIPSSLDGRATRTGDGRARAASASKRAAVGAEDAAMPMPFGRLDVRSGAQSSRGDSGLSRTLKGPGWPATAPPGGDQPG